MWRKIKANSSKITWSLGGNIIYALSQWAIVTILARFGSAEELGIYSLGLALTAPIVLFFNFQLRAVLVTDNLNEYEFSQYFGARILHLSISFIIIIPVAILYSDHMPTIIVIILMGLVKYFEALSDICMGLYQKKERLDIIGKSQFFKGIYSIILVGVIYILTNNLVLSVFGLLLVMALRFFIYDIKHIKQFGNIRPVFDKSAMTLVKMAYPLGITSLIVSLNTNIPRYFLDYFVGVKEVGVFSALYFILIAGNMLVTPLSQLSAPRIAKAFNSKEYKNFVKINLQFSIIVFLVFMIIFTPAIFKGDLILKIIYGSEYMKYHDILVMMLVSLFFGFIAAIQNISVIAARELKFQTLISIVTTVITIITGYYFIDLYGIKGAAYSLLISRIVQISLYFILLIFIIYKKWFRTFENANIVND